MPETETLPDQLLALGLLPSGAAAEIAGLRRHNPDDRALVVGLMERGLLTTFQARQVLRGRAHHLTVGRYMLLDRVGRGGMGQVFRARHRHLDRAAAIKISRLERHKCPHAMRRVLREARLAARMNHPNVVHALDAGEVRGTYYLALELVPGPDLGRVVRADGPLDSAAACEYARQAALGLDHIHRNGVVHRDVKPDNLGLADGERVVKVLDFGLAARAGRRVPRGDGKMKFVGSVDYVAPEQVTDTLRVTPRSDVYGLGATLYFLLTGQTPFVDGKGIAKAKQHLTGTPRPVEELCPPLPPGLGDLVRRMMARNPADRVGSAGDAAAELSRFAVPIAVPVAAAVVTSAGQPTMHEMSTLSE